MPAAAVKPVGRKDFSVKILSGGILAVVHGKQAPKTKFHASRKRHLIQIDHEDGLVLVAGIVQLVSAVGGIEILPGDERNEVSAAHDDAGDVFIPFTPGNQTFVIPDTIPCAVQAADDGGGTIRVAVGITDEYVGLTAVIGGERRILISHG